MKSVYERTQLNITEFDREDVITTSGPESTEPTKLLKHEEVENRFVTFSTFDLKPPTNNPWF